MHKVFLLPWGLSWRCHSVVQREVKLKWSMVFTFIFWGLVDVVCNLSRVFYDCGSKHVWHNFCEAKIVYIDHYAIWKKAQATIDAWILSYQTILNYPPKTLVISIWNMYFWQGWIFGKTWLIKYTKFYSVSDDITTLPEAYIFSINHRLMPIWKTGRFMDI